MDRVLNRIKLLAEHLVKARQFTMESRTTQDLDYAIAEVVAIGDNLGKYIDPKRQD